MLYLILLGLLIFLFVSGNISRKNNIKEEGCNHSWTE